MNSFFWWEESYVVQTGYVAEDDFEPLALLLELLVCNDSLVYVEIWLEPRGL